MIHKTLEDNTFWLAMAYEIPERVAEHAVLMHDEVEQIVWRAYAARHSKDGNDIQAMETWRLHLGPQDFRDLEEISVDMATRLCRESCRRPGHGQYKRRRPRVVTTGRPRVTIR
ncbi:hypothetical protein ACFY1P_29295 [Streptomyces sp. NPDC001407]|uniref:hypothetical protein n=1 Tax=unclassified Streptomyces TaxID=2593676 RepID=UPI0036CB7B52